MNFELPNATAYRDNDPTYICPIDRIMLYALVRGLRPKRALEIGAGWNGTTQLLAKAIHENGVGQLVGFDAGPAPHPPSINERHTVIAGFSPRDLPKAIEHLGGKPDFVFIDGMQTHDAVRGEINALLPHLDDHAHLVLHDTYHQGIDRAISSVVSARNDLIDCGFVTRSPMTTIPVASQGLRLIRKGGVDSEALIADAYHNDGKKPPPFTEQLDNFDEHYARIKASRSGSSCVASN